MIDRNDFEYRLAEHKRRTAASDQDPRHQLPAPPARALRATMAAGLRALAGLLAAPPAQPGPIASVGREETPDNLPRERLSPWG